YDIAAWDAVAIYAGTSLVIIDTGTLDVLAVGDATMTLGISGSSSEDGTQVGGTIQVDTCGFTGQHLFTFEACPAPKATEPGGIVPSIAAVSPGGRIAVAAGNNVLGVYARTSDATGACAYALDPAYGNGGVVTMPKGYRETTFDFE